MNYAAHMMLQFTDFFSLCKTGHDSKTTLCNVKYSKWYEPNASQMLYRVRADRFLRGMVRMAVGVMLLIGMNKLSIREFEMTIRKKKRFKYIMPVPPCGLYLTSVKYLPNIKLT